MPALMRPQAERRVQRILSKRSFFSGLAMFAAVMAFDQWLTTVPNRGDAPARQANVRFVPIVFDPARSAPLRLGGAWMVDVDDLRFGGISALAIEGGQLLALTDSGSLFELPKPDSGKRRAIVRDLPSGPGNPNFKYHRDSEALVRDPSGRGWWVAFEHHDELWLYDRNFGTALQRIPLGNRGWGSNSGVEGMATADGDLLLFPEAGDIFLRITKSRVRFAKIANSSGRISDAVAVDRERFLVVERRLTPVGFQNTLISLEKSPSGYRLGRRIPLSLKPLDNVEAIAVEHLAGGRRRLWLMTDDNFSPLMRTLLITFDCPESVCGESARLPLL